MSPRPEPLLLAALLLAACTGDPVPKPRGYFRIDLPEQAYERWEPPCPFAAEVPVYARPLGTARSDRPCWWNLTFPGQRAIVHLTYQRVNNDLLDLVNEAQGYKARHEVKADRIRTERVMNDTARVYGNLYAIEGDVASPFVFYVTDSTRHFLYGSLYFSARPNADSLAPVTERLRADLRHFVGTLRWRDTLTP
jgi:gliding motility-associated lipoprotein GldD